MNDFIKSCVGSRNIWAAIALAGVVVITGASSVLAQTAQVVPNDLAVAPAATNLTACTCIRELIQNVSDLSIKPGQRLPLVQTLEQAARAIVLCQVNPAGRRMARFVKQTQVLVKKGSLDQATADSLAICASTIRLCGIDCDVSTSNLPPVALVHAVTNAADANCQAEVTAAQVNNGSFSPNPNGSIVSMFVAPAGPFPLGSTTNVTLTVVDNQGAASSATTTVTVIDPGPAVTNFSTYFVVYVTPGQTNSMAVFPEPDVSDNCSGVASVSFAPPSGSVFPLGVTPAALIMVNGEGYTNQIPFNVVVLPNSGGGGSGGVGGDSNLPPVAIAQAVTNAAAANCQAGVTASQVNNGSFSPNPNGSIVSMSVEPAGPFPVGSTTNVTLTVVDNQEVSSSATTTVTVIDPGPAVTNFSTYFVVYVTPGQTNSMAVFPEPDVSDNCSGVASVSFAPPSGSVFPLGVTPAALIMVNGEGYTNQIPFNVVVLPNSGGGGGSSNLPPVAVAQAVTNAADANCQAGVTAAQVNNGSYSPNSNGSIVSMSVAPAGPFPVGSTTPVTLTVVDNQGASSSANTIVTVLDLTPPSILTPLTDITVAPALGQQSVVVNYPTLSVTDNCSSVVGVSYTPPSGTAFGIGTNTVTCEVFDAAGNTNSTTFQVIVTPFDLFACNSDTIPKVIQQVQTLPLTGLFTQVRRKDMLDKLNEAQQDVTLSKWTSAKYTVGGFITICSTYQNVGILSSEIASPLISCAASIQNSLPNQP